MSIENLSTLRRIRENARKTLRKLERKVSAGKNFHMILINDRRNINFALNENDILI